MKLARLKVQVTLNAKDVRTGWNQIFLDLRVVSLKRFLKLLLFRAIIIVPENNLGRPFKNNRSLTRLITEYIGTGTL